MIRGVRTKEGVKKTTNHPSHLEIISLKQFGESHS